MGERSRTEKNRPLVVRFMKAMAATMRWMMNNREPACGYLSKEMAISIEHCRHASEYNWKKRIWDRNADLNVEGVRTLIKITAEQGILKEPLPEPSKYHDPSDLKQAWAKNPHETGNQKPRGPQGQAGRRDPHRGGLACRITDDVAALEDEPQRRSGDAGRLLAEYAREPGQKRYRCRGADDSFDVCRGGSRLSGIGRYGRHGHLLSAHDDRHDPQLHQGKPRQGGEIPQGFSRRAGRSEEHTSEL